VQQAGFRALHAPGLARMVMIVPGQMQRAMYDQVRQVIRWTAPGGARLAQHGAEGKHDLSPSALSGQAGGGRWIGQHVGGLIAAAIAGIQPPHLTVGGEHDIGVGAGDARGAAGGCLGLPYVPPPRWITDEYLG